jgi:hypothetical protein
MYPAPPVTRILAKHFECSENRTENGDQGLPDELALSGSDKKALNCNVVVTKTAKYDCY